MFSKTMAILMMSMLCFSSASSLAEDAPPFSRTQIKLITPFQSGHVGIGFAVIGQEKGSCFARSAASPDRPDAWRCTVGNAIQDPCLESVTGDPKVLACVRDPWSANVTLLTLTSPLPQESPSKSDWKDTLPWALELANGRHCTLMTDATAPIAGMRINYGCPDGSIVAGDIDRSQPVWRVFAQGAKSTSLDLTDIAVAWY